MRSALASVMLLLIAQPAFAQGGWQGRVRIGVSAGLQPESAGLSEEGTLTKNFESTPIAVNVPAADVPFFDVGLAFRVAGNLGIGLAVSSVSNRDDADISASIPHPFFFDRPRPIEGRALGFSRSELGLHTHIVYVIALPGRVEITPQGGATLFQVTQDLVTDVNWDDEYPFDTAEFASATKARATASKIGYNAGVDVSWMASRHWGVGGLVRYSKASIPLDVDGETAATVDAGGLQAAAGLRLAF